MRQFKKWNLIVLLALFPLTAWGQTGHPVLDKFFSEVEGFKADFTQVVYDENFREVQSSSGQMALQRPDRFRWVYVKPYEQVIVADGQSVWIYDADLEQVTVKSQGDALGETPAQLLSSAKPIVDAFSVRELGERGGLGWFELMPLTDENAYEAIRLAFKGQALRRMEMQDGLGNRTHFEFTNITINPQFDKTQFSFSPPEGVDVIGRE